MIKRKLLAVVLPLVGCATVVGSGFAAWYFGEIETTRGNTSTSVNVNVTKEVNNASGLLNFDEELTDDLSGNVLVLDQGGINSDETQGIMIGSKTDNETVEKSDIDYSFTLNWGPTGDGDPVDLFKIYEAGMKVQLTVTIELTGNLSKYIEMVDGYSLNCPDSSKEKFTTTDNKVYTAVWTAAKPAGETMSDSWDFNLGFDTSAELKNEAFKYKVYGDGDEEVPFTGKPSKTGEPATMAGALAEIKEEEGEPRPAATVEINVVAELVDTKTGA